MKGGAANIHFFVFVFGLTEEIFFPLYLVSELGVSQVIFMLSCFLR